VKYHGDALSIPNSLLDAFNLARLNLNMAVALLILLRFPEAEKTFRETIQLYAETGAVAWRLNAMDGLAMTYIGWQKFDQAIFILHQALAELPTVVDAPNYSYLYDSLHKHWEEAHQGLHSMA
jgi:tetratricopeptide (TPR) repeat protein